MGKEGGYYKCKKPYEICCFDGLTPVEPCIGLSVDEGSVWECHEDQGIAVKLRLFGTPFQVVCTVDDGFFNEHYEYTTDTPDLPERRQ